MWSTRSAQGAQRASTIKLSELTSPVSEDGRPTLAVWNSFVSKIMPHAMRNGGRRSEHGGGKESCPFSIG